MTHKAKLKMARKMMTAEEIKLKVSPFGSRAWNERKRAIEERVKREIKQVKKGKK